MALCIGSACLRPPDQCPSEATLRDLHAAAFFFQNDHLAQARSRLASARQNLASTPPDPVTKQLLAELSNIESLSDAARDERARRAEHVRLLFAGWPCLPEAVHQRFHLELPPLPNEATPAR